MTVQPIRKRIVICCDGTWQSAVDGNENIPSNVTRLCRAINSVDIDKNDHQPWQQIVWYDSGVGTTSAGMLSAGIEGALGKGLEGNIIEAYNFCVLNWNPGDQIMCFGFSRGAYTARAIAGLIADIGICSRNNIADFPELWKLYKKNPPGQPFYGSAAYYDFFLGRVADNPVGEEQPQVAWEFSGRPEWGTPESREIEVVGVFDTVGALGFPEVMGYEIPSWLLWTDKPEWHNVGLSPNIKNAFHALALDEHRGAFTPTMFHVPVVDKIYSLEDIAKQEDELLDALNTWAELVMCANPAVQTLRNAEKARNDAAAKLLKMEDSRKKRTQLKQVWFPGFHIHIGGGSSETLKNQGNMEEMSNIVFGWMLDQIKGFLSLNERTLFEEEELRQARLNKLNWALDRYKEKEKMWKTEPWGKWLWRNGQRVASSIRHPLTPSDAPAYDKHRKYGWGTGDLPDSFDVTYRLNGSKTRTPRRYLRDPKTKEILGETFEEIHPTVGFRVKQTAEDEEASKRYRPIWLTGDRYDRRRKKNGKGNEYWFKYPGETEYEVLPEWELETDDRSYERYAVQGEEALDYVDTVDQECGYQYRFNRMVQHLPLYQRLGETWDSEWAADVPDA
ncbi:hypothetical protein BDV28DRAFT_139818 [Aspergillus coremiiformis]|uniref:T6SS Phospholipase effector Tle1-like catalytic domain-containing protein n=1 Tax=Aspergillus coremiiformis TaxID=138285 RepID=A0A5N6Z255_9EURO|nr:hypothetical protein BDV28DRAFT_139818 [Aspergillus coremiiformis]